MARFKIFLGSPAATGGGGLTYDGADSVSTTDSAAKAASSVRADSVSTSDAPSKTIRLSLSDSVSVTDSLTKVFQSQRSDFATVVDVISYPSALTLILGDSVNASDSIILPSSGKKLGSSLVVERRDMKLERVKRDDDEILNIIKAYMQWQ